MSAQEREMLKVATISELSMHIRTMISTKYTYYMYMYITYIHTYTYTHLYIHIRIYICTCQCMCNYSVPIKTLAVYIQVRICMYFIALFDAINVITTHICNQVRDISVISVTKITYIMSDYGTYNQRKAFSLKCCAL